MAQKLKNSVINGFCGAELGWLILSQMVTSYTAFYLTDIVKVPPAIIGTLMLVTNVACALLAPFVGQILENVSFKWGKYRSWLYVGGIGTAIIYVFFWTNFPSMSTGTKTVFYSALYLLTSIGTLFYVSAMNALIAVMGQEPNDRVKLSARRVQMISASSILGGLIIMPMILALGGGNQGKGFMLAAIIYGILMSLGYILMAYYAKPYVDAIPKEARKQVSLGEMFQQIFANRHLLVLLLAEIARMSSRFSIFGLAVYYFKYVANNMLMVATFFTSIGISILIGSFAGEIIAKRFSKKPTYIIGLIIMVAGLVAAYLFAGGNASAFIGCFVVAIFGLGIANAVPLSMYADTADYSEWKTGKNSYGVVMAIYNLPLKLAIACSGALVGFSLASVGYVANAKPTPELVSSINFVVSLIPAILAALAIVFILFYKLSDSKVAELKQEISNRNIAAK